MNEHLPDVLWEIIRQYTDILPLRSVRSLLCAPEDVFCVYKDSVYWRRGHSLYIDNKQVCDLPPTAYHITAINREWIVRCMSDRTDCYNIVTRQTANGGMSRWCVYGEKLYFLQDDIVLCFQTPFKCTRFVEYDCDNIQYYNGVLTAHDPKGWYFMDDSPCRYRGVVSIHYYNQYVYIVKRKECTTSRGHAHTITYSVEQTAQYKHLIFIGTDSWKNVWNLKSNQLEVYDSQLQVSEYPFLITNNQIRLY